MQVMAELTEGLQHLNGNPTVIPAGNLHFSWVQNELFLEASCPPQTKERFCPFIIKVNAMIRASLLFSCLALSLQQ